MAGKGAPIRGTEMFNLMMRSFGSTVRAIAGTWRRSFEGHPSSNIDEVNRLTAEGVPLEKAVYHAWTSKRAARWGFTNVRLRKIEGVPGNYSKIDVLIEKGEDPR